MLQFSNVKSISCTVYEIEKTMVLWELKGEWETLILICN